MLTDKQRQCKHDSILKIASSKDKYYNAPRKPWPKVEISCEECGIIIKVAGVIYVNRKEAIHGIITEHSPELLK